MDAIPTGEANQAMASKKWIVALKDVIAGKTSTKVFQVLRDCSRSHPDSAASYENTALWLQFIQSMEKFLKQAASSRENLTLKDTNRFYCAAMLVLDIGSSKVATNKDLLVSKCIPLIFRFLTTEFTQITFRKKRPAKPLSVFLAYLSNFIKTYDLPKQHMESFITACCETSLFCFHNTALQIDTILLLVAAYSNKIFHMDIIQSLLKCMCRSDRSTKKSYISLNLEKFSAVAVCVSAIVQHGLCMPGESVAVFQSSFLFAAKFIDTLVQAAISNKGGNCYLYLDSFINDLLRLSDSVQWVSSRLQLNMVTKTLTARLVDPATPPKFKVFAVKHIAKLAICLKTHLTTYYKIWDELLKKREALEAKDDINKYILAAMVEFPANTLYGDVTKAHRVVMAKYGTSGPTELPENITLEEVNSLAYVQEAARNSNDDFFNYVKFIITAANDKNRIVKTAAAKNLESLIIAEPVLLLCQQIEKTMDLCLNHATAHGRCAIASVLESFLSNHPHVVTRYIPHFRALLADDAQTVRRSAITAIASIFKSNSDFSSPTLVSFVLPLIGDPEETVQKAVASFFREIWLERDEYVPCLVDTCLTPNSLNWISRILMASTCQQAAFCQSQALRVVPQELQVYGEGLQRLTENVVSTFNNNKTLRQNEAAVAITKVISEISPSTILPHMTLFKEVIFGNNVESLKRLSAETMSNAIHLLDDIGAQEIKELLLKDLEGEHSLSYSLAYRTSLLKLLLKVCSKDRAPLANIVKKSVIFLQKAQENLGQEDHQLIKKALSIVVFVWREYAKNQEAKNLIHRFFTNPKYNLTVLSVSCQVRLEYIPSERDVFLEKQIQKFLKDRSSAQLTTTALYFLNCTLRGYQKIQQQPEMKTLGDTTTEAVSALVQKTLPSILLCSIDVSSDIRKAACPVVDLIVQSGLILMTKLLPHILAMTTDTEATVKSAGRGMLHYAAEVWDITSSVVEGLRLAFSLKKSLLNVVLARGVDQATHEASFRWVYEAVRSSPPKRRKLVDVIIHEVANCTDLEFIVYLLDQLIGFPYKLCDELLYVLTSINGFLTRHEALSPTHQKIHHSFALYAALRTKLILSDAYNITTAKMDDFETKGSNKDELKAARNFKDLLLEIAPFLDEGHSLLDAVKDLIIIPEISQDSDCDEDNIPLAQLQQMMLERSLTPGVEKANDITLDVSVPSSHGKHETSSNYSISNDTSHDDLIQKRDESLSLVDQTILSVSLGERESSPCSSQSNIPLAQIRRSMDRMSNEPSCGDSQDDDIPIAQIRKSNNFTRPSYRKVQSSEDSEDDNTRVNQI